MIYVALFFHYCQGGSAVLGAASSACMCSSSSTVFSSAGAASRCSCDGLRSADAMSAAFEELRRRISRSIGPGRSLNSRGVSSAPFFPCVLDPSDGAVSDSFCLLLWTCCNSERLSLGPGDVSMLSNSATFSGAPPQQHKRRRIISSTREGSSTRKARLYRARRVVERMRSLPRHRT